MKYKVGDRVRIKSIDWYNKNKNENGDVSCGEFNFVEGMKKYCSETFTILDDDGDYYLMMEDYLGYMWTDEMIEGCVDSIEDKMKELRKMCTINLTDSNYSDKVEVLLNDYEYIEEEGKSYFVKKKKEYPNTYEECCEIIHSDPNFYVDTHLYSGTLETLYKLLICRDAYWEIAGQEMGLDGPWEPDWNSGYFTPAIIYRSGFIQKVEVRHRNAILVFPTKEMRDAFYENFKELIEMCKELL